MNLIDQLVDAAYNTGYYSGKKEDGQPHHAAAILRRERLRHEVLDMMRTQAETICKLYRRIDAANLGREVPV